MNMRAQRHPGLRQWLEEKIESGKYKNLTWEDRDNLEFSIPWRHASSREWSQNEDAALFRDWAIYKKKFKKGKKGIISYSLATYTQSTLSSFLVPAL